MKPAHSCANAFSAQETRRYLHFKATFQAPVVLQGDHGITVQAWCRTSAFDPAWVTGRLDKSAGLAPSLALEDAGLAYWHDGMLG